MGVMHYLQASSVIVVVAAVVVRTVVATSRLLLVTVVASRGLHEELIVGGQGGDVTITLSLDSTGDLGEVGYSHSLVTGRQLVDVVAVVLLHFIETADEEFDSFGWCYGEYFPIPINLVWD